MHKDLQSVEFTATQKRILEILSDGKNHAREELIPILGPCSKSNLKVHMCLLRKKLVLLGHDIVPIYVYPNKVFWRHVILLVKP